jgi:alkanesulfonate monooxygenase SsuD/methylene tetrahydromethanopterin reductase-like flavin-dependent oxidoreductase (luciferase family)
VNQPERRDVNTRYPVRFGIQLQAQRTTWPTFVGALQAVEELGFDTVYTFDHLLPVDGQSDGSCFETMTTVAAMAAVTNRIRVGSLCNGVMYRDPATFAKAGAMIDQISGGRYECTLGPAWAAREFSTYGLPFPGPGERLRRLDEALTIVRSLWTEPRTTFEGNYYVVRDAPCEPKTVQRPYPPIMIGGGRDGTARLAAKHADAWNGIGSAAFCAGRIAAIERFCEDLGRDPTDIEYSAHPELAVASSTREAENIATEVAAGHGRRFEDERHLWVVGTPDEVRQQIDAYISVGVTHLIFALPNPFDTKMLERFVDDVLPAYRTAQ